MNMNTPEPWYLEPSEETTNAYEVKCKGGYYVATAHDAVRGFDDPKENARRIVACVNACEGISTEQLESWLCMSRPIRKSLEELKSEADREGAQRDEMLAVLQMIASKRWYRGCAMLGPDQMKAVDNAIARATGDQP